MNRTKFFCAASFTWNRRFTSLRFPALGIERWTLGLGRFLLSTAMLVSVLPAFAGDPDLPLKPGLDVITPDSLLAHIKVLSSDEYEGRAPGSKGEELSVSYISDQ